MSHLGRPKGQVDKKLSLKPVAAELSKLLNKQVLFLPDCIGSKVEEKCAEPPQGSVILLENLRFYAAETGKKATDDQKKEFRESLSKLGDVYVNDAFGTAHRAHSSMVGVNLKVRAGGLLMKKELKSFGKVLENPNKPVLAILGGAKISDKMKLITNMLDKVDSMIIAGAMAFSFLKHAETPMEIGKSLYDDQAKDLCPQIIKAAAEKKVELIFPCDFVCCDDYDFSEAKVKDPVEKHIKNCTVKEGVPKGFMGLDCGEESGKLFSDAISKSKTLIWNGPPGVFECEKFAGCTKSMLKAVVEATKNGCITVVGGGDTASAV
eukprot:UN30288